MKKESNVRSLADARRRREEEEPDIDADIAEVYFAEVMEKNKQVKDKRKKEIAQANKKVLRSYRIKH